MNELALFAGAGGGILGGKLLGWRTVCAVELDAYCRRVLLARQRDGFLPRFPIWDNVETFDGKPWRGHIDVVSGGFPCTDISSAGRGAGIEGKQSGLWKHMARIVGEVRPRYVFVENSPLLVRRGLAVVIGDLAAMGYDARWGVVGAHHLAASHKRDRIWILAQPNQQGLEKRTPSQGVQQKRWISTDGPQRPTLQQEWIDRCRAQWASDAGILRVAHGIPHRVDRIRAIGNAQVPQVAALAWRLLGGPMT